MRPLLCGFVAVVVLFVAVCIFWIALYLRKDPSVPVGLGLIWSTATEPVFLALYVAGFGVTYWLARR